MAHFVLKTFFAENGDFWWKIAVFLFYAKFFIFHRFLFKFSKIFTVLKKGQKIYILNVEIMENGD